jgi:hypothetical protein
LGRRGLGSHNFRAFRSFNFVLSSSLFNTSRQKRFEGSGLAVEAQADHSIHDVASRHNSPTCVCQKLMARRRRDSCPSEKAMGGLWSKFGPIRTPTHYPRRRRRPTLPTPRRPRTPTRSPGPLPARRGRSSPPVEWPPSSPKLLYRRAASGPARRRRGSGRPRPSPAAWTGAASSSGAGREAVGAGPPFGVRLGRGGGARAARRSGVRGAPRGLLLRRGRAVAGAAARRPLCLRRLASRFGWPAGASALRRPLRGVALAAPTPRVVRRGRARPLCSLRLPRPRMAARCTKDTDRPSASWRALEGPKPSLDA